jgi:hypothetical protein
MGPTGHMGTSPHWGKPPLAGSQWGTGRAFEAKPGASCGLGGLPVGPLGPRGGPLWRGQVPWHAWHVMGRPLSPWPVVSFGSQWMRIVYASVAAQAAPRADSEVRAHCTHSIAHAHARTGPCSLQGPTHIPTPPPPLCPEESLPCIG